MILESQVYLNYYKNKIIKTDVQLENDKKQLDI